MTATSQTPSSSSPLIGSWRLISFELRDDAGTVSRPWGRAVSGITTFTADGYLAEQFGSAHRPDLTHDDWGQRIRERDRSRCPALFRLCGHV